MKDSKRLQAVRVAAVKLSEKQREEARAMSRVGKAGVKSPLQKPYKIGAVITKGTKGNNKEMYIDWEILKNPNLLKRL